DDAEIEAEPVARLGPTNFSVPALVADEAIRERFREHDIPAFGLERGASLWQKADPARRRVSLGGDEVDIFVRAPRARRGLREPRGAQARARRRFRIRIPREPLDVLAARAGERAAGIAGL